MTRPRRVQLRRTKGWRKPEGTIVVARPSKWGNPFAVPAARHAGRTGTDAQLRAQCVEDYRRWLTGGLEAPAPDAEAARRRIVGSLDELRGRDLACWCPLGQPCHADVLLEMANAGAVAPPGDRAAQ